MEELFAYFFGIYIKFGYKNPSILTLLDSVDVASYAEWLVLSVRNSVLNYFFREITTFIPRLLSFNDFFSHSIFSLWSKLLKIVPKMKIRDRDCPSFFQAVYWIFAMKRLKLWRLWPNSNAPAPFSRTFSTPKPTMLSSTVVFFSSTQWWNVKLG